MSQFDDAAKQVATLLITSALLMVGCSGSSDSPTVFEGDNVGNADDSVINSGEAGANNDPIESNASTSDTADGEADEETSVSTPDPLVQNITRVDFEITVPAYQSDALQVSLTWGSTQANAAWVGDELWTTSLELPTATEQELMVTFFDDNGEVALASFEQSYRTGSNTAEMVTITADQFNSEQWDSDNDGASNLQELIAGSDPLINEDSLLEIRENTEVSLGFIESNFESRIPEERPYNEYYEEQLTYHEGGRPPSGASHTIDISIDENGNGLLSDSRLSGVGLWPIETSYNGTRTHSDNSITWDARLQTIQDFADLVVTTSSVNTVSIIDAQTRRYKETYEYSYDNHNQESTITTIEIDLIGEVIEGTSHCQPVSGTFESETTRPHDRNAPIIRRSITKETDDQYWRVEHTSTGDEPSETEYLARNLDSTFQCDFVEF